MEEFEDDMETGMEELHGAFRQRFEKEQKRVLDVCNADYYFVVCFSNKGQLDEFCSTVGLNPDEIYYDGRVFARKINRALKTPDTVFPKILPFSKDYTERARNKEGT